MDRHKRLILIGISIILIASASTLAASFQIFLPVVFTSGYVAPTLTSIPCEPGPYPGPTPENCATATFTPNPYPPPPGNTPTPLPTSSPPDYFLFLPVLR